MGGVLDGYEGGGKYPLPGNGGAKLEILVGRGQQLELGVGAGGVLVQLHVEGLGEQLFQQDIMGGGGFFQLHVQGD